MLLHQWQSTAAQHFNCNRQQQHQQASNVAVSSLLLDSSWSFSIAIGVLYKTCTVIVLVLKLLLLLLSERIAYPEHIVIAFRSNAGYLVSQPYHHRYPSHQRRPTELCYCRESMLAILSVNHIIIDIRLINEGTTNASPVEGRAGPPVDALLRRFWVYFHPKFWWRVI